MAEEIKPVPEHQIFPAHWTPLPAEVREYLAKVFTVGRSVSTEIVDNKIISDGRGVNDLKAITLEAMQAYANSKEKDFYHLWTICVSKAKSELNPPKEIKLEAVAKVASVEAPVPAPKKTGLEPLSAEKAAIANTLMGNKTPNGKESKTK